MRDIRENSTRELSIKKHWLRNSPYVNSIPDWEGTKGHAIFVEIVSVGQKEHTWGGFLSILFIYLGKAAHVIWGCVGIMA